jgi:hypothetical protein
MRSAAAAEFSVPPSLPYLERLMPAKQIVAGRPYVMFTSVQLQSTIYDFFSLLYKTSWNYCFLSIWLKDNVSLD